MSVRSPTVREGRLGKLISGGFVPLIVALPDGRASDTFIVNRHGSSEGFLTSDGRVAGVNHFK
jgi:hypothetical protein